MAGVGRQGEGREAQCAGIPGAVGEAQVLQGLPLLGAPLRVP